MDDPLAGSESASLDQLEGRRLMLFESGPLSAAFAQAVKQRFAKKALNVIWLDPVRNVDLLSDVVSEAEAGAIVPKHAASFHSDLSAIVLEDLFPTRMALYSERNSPNPAVMLFRAVALDVAKTIRL